MFRTELHPKKPDFQLETGDSFITAGSCFSEVIGNRLRENKFKVLANPFGVIFHPGIICELLLMALNGQSPSSSTFVETEGRWVSYLLHSKISGPDPLSLQQKIQTLFKKVNQELRTANVLVITSGTAFLYEHKMLKTGVANCQKQPQKIFDKRLSDLNSLHNSFDAFYSALTNVNPSVKVILTVSPVRHIKDSLELNAVSKSVLRLWCHQLIERYPALNYFPGYELLLDDLRDYRFYGRDLLHPSEEAEDYIWQKFTNACFSEPAKKFLRDWNEIRSALAHRPFNPASGAHQTFIRKTIAKLESFSSVTDVSEELNALKNQLL